MNPNVTNTVPATQEEGALRIVPEQQQSSPDVTHSAATTVKLLPKVAEREKCHRHSETFDHEKPVQLRYGDIELVDDAVEHRTGKQALAAVGIES